MRVSIQQAAANALAAHLRAHLVGVDVQDRWPDPDNWMQLPRVTMEMISDRQDIPIPPHITAWDGQVATWQIALCTQTFQVDVWTSREVERDDILAQLDDVCNWDPSGDINRGLLLQALPEDGWPDAYFNFYFESPETHNGSFVSIPNEFRARYMVHAYFGLTVDRAAPKTKLIEFQQRITETDAVSQYDITNIT